jgi:hypothetical protein
MDAALPGNIFESKRRRRDGGKKSAEQHSEARARRQIGRGRNYFE